MIQLHAQQTIREQKRFGIKSVRKYFWKSIFIPNQQEESTKTSKNRRFIHILIWRRTNYWLFGTQVDLNAKC